MGACFLWVEMSETTTCIVVMTHGLVLMYKKNSKTIQVYVSTSDTAKPLVKHKPHTTRISRPRRYTSLYRAILLVERVAE